MMLNEVLAGVTVGEAVGWKGLSVFPLSHGNGHAPAYALIDELLESKQAQITELDDMGSVPTVKVLNHADVDALILDGMELHGAKQNRMVNVTVVIGELRRAGTVVVPVARVCFREAHGGEQVAAREGAHGCREPCVAGGPACGSG
jgi:hypothetical protein